MTNVATNLLLINKTNFKVTVGTHEKTAKRPKISAMNGLLCDEIPEELMLTDLEQQMIALDLLFMKMKLLPKSRMPGMVDRVVNVPLTDDAVMKTMHQLPRTLDESQLVPISFKRKKDMKNTHAQAYVRPAKMINGLNKLKELGNPHYQGINVDKEFGSKNKEIDPELWDELTKGDDNKDTERSASSDGIKYVYFKYKKNKGTGIYEFDGECENNDDNEADTVIVWMPTTSLGENMRIVDNIENSDSSSDESVSDSIPETSEEMETFAIAKLLGVKFVYVRFRKIHRSKLVATVKSGQKKLLFPDLNKDVSDFAFIEEFKLGTPSHPASQRALAIKSFSIRYDNQEFDSEDFKNMSNADLEDYFFIRDDSEPNVNDGEVYLDLMLDEETANIVDS